MTHEHDETPDVSYIHNVGVSHEESDLSLSGIGKFVLHLIALVIISAAIVFGMFKYFTGREVRIERRELPSTLLDRGRAEKTKPEQMFPEPRLQTTPVPDLTDFREKESQRLEGYNWVNKEQGIVSIPIEEAQKKLLEKGIPHREEGKK
ncbi:MAG: hypothetical protein AB1757_09800 [Acidobacteriota bacterium]